MALNNFGAGRIASINEDSEQATLFRSIYENARQSLLAKGCWNFAIGYEQLSKIHDANIYHPVFSNIYVYPAQVIKIIKVFCSDIDLLDRYNYQNFEVFSYRDRRYIGTDLVNAKAKIVYDVENPSLYSPEFVTCFSFLLASRISEALTRNGQIVQEMENKYQASLNEAMLTNAVEGESKIQYPDRFIRFRNSTNSTNFGGRR